MARWFARSTERSPSEPPAWLWAPGVSAGPPSGPQAWSVPRTEHPGPPPPRPQIGEMSPLPTGQSGRGDAHPRPVTAPPAGRGPHRELASPGPARFVGAGEVDPARFGPPAAPAASSPAGRGTRPAPIEPMHGGYRVTTGETQMWIGAAARPAPVTSAACASRTVRSAEQPGWVQRPSTNGHDLRVVPPVGGPPPRLGLTRPAVSGPAALQRSIAALDPISDGEAAAFAARFAADYLSFDEDDPSLRAHVLRGYLADPHAATLGWSSLGRQRADIVLPGRTLRTDDGTVVVEVTARVTTYRRDLATSSPAEPAPDLPPIPASTVGPSCAPSESAPGWVACPAQWVRIAPPVRRSDTGALVVDLGCAPAGSATPAAARPDHVDPGAAPRTPERDPESVDPDSVADGGPA